MQVDQQIPTFLPNEHTPQQIISLSPSDPNLKFSLENIKVSLGSSPHTIPYLAEQYTEFTEFPSLIDFLKSKSDLKDYKLLRLEISFDQSILLEVLIFMYNSFISN